MSSGSAIATLFFLAISPVAGESVATESNGKTKEGACLLNTRRTLTKSELELGEGAEAHRQWRAKHELQIKELKKSEGVLDDFITAQAQAGTACSARMMEAKRALDKLNEEAKSLANQVNSHEEVLETESENLAITKSSITAVEEEYDADVKECDRLKAEAIKDMKQYAAELKELKEIANPKARYTDKVTVEVPTPPPEAEMGLLELGEFTRETCLAFVHFLNRKGRSRADPAQACDKEREELQEAFTQAWKDINDLKDDAKARSEDKSCYEAATAKQTAAMIPMAAAREQQTARIEHANDAIAALEPVVNMLKERIEKMKDHIDEKLTPECMEAGEVSKILQNIRDLITMVEECPGGGKFQLAIPKDTAPIQQRS